MSIEQDGLKVRMVVETPEGEKEHIEETMDQYNQLIKRQIAPDHLFDNKADVIELKQQLNFAKVQLETQRDLLALKDEEMHRTAQRVDFLERQYDRLTDILHNTLSPSIQKTGQLEALILQVSKGDNAIVLEALQILKLTIERGVTLSDENHIKDALKTIKEQKPSILEHVVDILKGSASGTTANLLYSWIARILGALPK